MLNRLLLAWIFFTCILLHAEEKSYTSRYVISYPVTIEKGLMTPMHWQSKDWLTAGTVVAVGTGLYLKDEDINSWIHEHRSHFTHEAAKVGNVFGEGKYMFPAVGVVWLTGYVSGSEKTQDTGALMLKTMLLTGGVTSVLKYATQRNRPQAHKGKQLWSEPGFNFDTDSFPSGHATIAFSMATVLAEQYKSTVYIPILTYSGATLTSYARMHDQRHWSSDVFTGAVVGYFTAKLVMNTTPRLYVSPVANMRGISCELIF